MNQPQKPAQPNDPVVSSHEVHEALQNAPEQRFFSTGMRYLDELTGGFAEGDFVVLGGNQKSGKSQFLVTLVRNLTKKDVPCLFLEMELSYREFLERFGAELPVFYLPRKLSVPTLTWIESKIDEAVARFGVKVVFIDDLRMIADEATFRERNAVDILDQRLLKIKHMALSKRLCIVAVNPFVTTAIRKKKAEMDTSDFRGTATIGYTADTLLGIERLAGRTSVRTAQDAEEAGDLLLDTTTYIHILDCRRTGARRVRIKCHLNEHGELVED